MAGGECGSPGDWDSGILRPEIQFFFTESLPCFRLAVARWPQPYVSWIDHLNRIHLTKTFDKTAQVSRGAEKEAINAGRPRSGDSRGACGGPLELMDNIHIIYIYSNHSN